MSELFAVDVSTINYHLKQIDESGEVHLSEAIRKIQIPGILMYNMDVIIAVGYRVRGVRGTQFRQWATEHLTEYLVSIFFAFAALKFDQLGEFFHDSTKEMQAFLCIRCSKIWYFTR